MAKNIIEQALVENAMWKKRIEDAKLNAQAITKAAEDDKADARFLRLQAENTIILQNVILKAPEWVDYFRTTLGTEEEEAKEMLAASEKSDEALKAEVMKVKLLAAF